MLKKKPLIKQEQALDFQLWPKIIEWVLKKNTAIVLRFFSDAQEDR